ncbi:alpha/beta fold hydrolase [Thalassotalea maritima]|uniref:alpha/beta fold hydrolase n=1 Tax=Thalassotalea maritima TaxID=3242416 RepID=UPI003526EA2B
MAHNNVSTYQLSSETELDDNQAAINDRWQHGIFDSFTSHDGLAIHYALFNIDAARPWIVISPGRSESYLKYQEVTYDFINNGYNVALIDHRGQGLSERELEDKHKGYVANFNDYVDDLHQLVSDYVLPLCNSKPLLLGHSMGGNIAILYLQRYPDVFAAAALTAPMIAVDVGSVPAWLAKAIVKLIHHLNRLLTTQSWYFPGYGPFKEKKFDGNDLMQSAQRFALFQALYKKHSEIQLGGVTFAWLSAAINAEQQIFTNICKLTTPIMMLQSGDESIVCNDKQDTFYQALQMCPNSKADAASPRLIDGALHELLFESDHLRNQALSHILDWFANKQSSVTT